MIFFSIVFFYFFIFNSLNEFMKACRSGCNPSWRRGYWTHTKEIYVRNGHTSAKKLVSVMCQQKVGNVAEKTKAL